MKWNVAKTLTGPHTVWFATLREIIDNPNKIPNPVSHRLHQECMTRTDGSGSSVQFLEGRTDKIQNISFFMSIRKCESQNH